MAIHLDQEVLDLLLKHYIGYLNECFEAVGLRVMSGNLYSSPNLDDLDHTVTISLRVRMR